MSGPGSARTSSSPRSRRTRAGRGSGAPGRTPPPPDRGAADADEAIARFFEMESEIRRHGDVRMIQGEHLRAWLATSVGPLLRGVMLKRGVDADVLSREATKRLALPFSRELPTQWFLANQLEEKRLDVLYNLTMNPAGGSYRLDPADLRSPQRQGWPQSLAG